MNEAKPLNQWSRKELLALPLRDWQGESQYDSLLVFGTGEKHDSGWSLITIIGVRNYQPVEIACDCADDLEWIFPMPQHIGTYQVGQVRSDCALKSRAMHFWSHEHKFTVGTALSSTKIVVKK